MMRKWLVAIVAMSGIGLANPVLSRPVPPAPDWWVVITSNNKGDRGVYLVDKAGVRVGADDHRGAELYLITNTLVLESRVEFDCRGRQVQVLSSWTETGGVRRDVAPVSWTPVADIPSLRILLDFVCETPPGYPQSRSLGDVEPVSAGRAFIRTGIVI